MNQSKIIFILICLILLASCSNIDREVIFYTQTDHQEVLADFDYHLSGLEKYLDKQSIPHTRFENLTDLKSNLPKKVLNKIGNEVESNFMMILIINSERFEIHYNFGTDIDLMLVINEFFQIGE